MPIGPVVKASDCYFPFGKSEDREFNPHIGR